MVAKHIYRREQHLKSFTLAQFNMVAKRDGDLFDDITRFTLAQFNMVAKQPL